MSLNVTFQPPLLCLVFSFQIQDTPWFAQHIEWIIIYFYLKFFIFPNVFLRPATVDYFSYENKNCIGLFKMFKSSSNIFILFMQWIVFFIRPSSFCSSSSSRETPRLFQAWTASPNSFQLGVVAWLWEFFNRFMGIDGK